MDSQRMIEIAQSLGHCYAKKSELTVKIVAAKMELEAELLRSTPAEGWPGKNAEERKLNADRAAMENARAAEQRAIIAQTEGELSGLQAGIDGLEAERRALEWEVRAALVSVLFGKQEVKGNAENTAFDDAQDDSALTDLEQELEEELAGVLPDDIPF
jgi:hypothetical protein